MVFLGTGAVYLAVAVVTALAPGVPGHAWLLAASICYAVGIVGVTLAFNVPLNNGLTALNPKGIVFFVAFLPQFVRPGADSTRQFWILGSTFVMLAAIDATLYTVFASSARRWLSSPRAQRRFNLAGGSLLTGAGVWALLAGRPA